jgi:hypothetical protein
MVVHVSLLCELLMFLHINQISWLQRYDIEEILTIILYQFNLLYQLVNVDSVLFYPRAMRFHNLLADISFRVGWHVLPLHDGSTIWSCAWIITHIIIATRHILHFHVIGHWFLSIDLTNERLHALCQTLRNLSRHVRDDVDDFFLPLLSFEIRLDHIQKVVVLNFLLRHVILHVILSLYLRMVTVRWELFEELSALMKEKRNTQEWGL